MNHKAFDYRQKQLDAVKTIEDVLEFLTDEHHVSRVNIYEYAGKFNLVVDIPDYQQAESATRLLLGDKYRRTNTGFAVDRRGDITSTRGEFPLWIRSELDKQTKIDQLTKELAELGVTTDV